MAILDGLKNFLELINNNWTLIVFVSSLILAISKKISAYFSKNDEEKIEIAKKQIKEIMLKLISDAEEDYSKWLKAGSIKRSQVIEEIFLEYPILYKVTNQEKLIEWIDEIIDEALVTFREIVKT